MHAARLEDEPQRSADPGAGARLRALLITEGALVPAGARTVASGADVLRLDRAGQLEAACVIRETAPSARMLASVASNPLVPSWLREALA